MSSSCKSRIPERVKHSLTALHGPNSRISRVRSPVRSNRCSLFRSRLPLPIRTLAMALVSEMAHQPEVPKPKPRARETETEAVIRSLVRRSIPPAVRGNRTSFRRIQMAHSLPQVASVSLVMKPSASRWENQHQPSQNQQLQPPNQPGSTEPTDRTEDDEISAKSLLELVAGKWQPDMQTMRFLCSDHRLINVPSRLMNRHSVVMDRLEALEQPIELRAIRSVTLLRVVMWMHQKSLSGEVPTSSDDADKQSCICDNQSNAKGNGNENEETNTSTMENDMYSDSGSEDSDDSSTEVSESTQEIVTSTTETIESIKYQICRGYTRSRYESTDSTLIRNRIHRPYSRGGLESDDENICENYENAENLRYRKLNGYTEGGNSKLNANGSGSDKESAITNRYASSQQDRFLISPKDSGIFRENSGRNNHNGMENGKEKGYIEGELSEHITFRNSSSQKKPNLSHSNVNVNVNLSEKTGMTLCAQKVAPNVGQNQRSEPSSWEQRLLGSELYQLVELILAAHYLGINALTLLATHHFGELMAQRTRSERCLMLRIRNHLAGVRQTLDTHRPLIREIVTQAEAASNWMRHRRTTGGPFLSPMEPPLLLANNRHRHHQNCFHTRM
ncbi:uncharacterized protein [Drosophila takahashii]|uniref:uncharacterized protein n=1 Tax=Drosophila takahashii TaxID=29030 RepID=UPI0038995953